MERSIKSNPLNKSIGKRKQEYPRPYKGVVNKKATTTNPIAFQSCISKNFFFSFLSLKYFASINASGVGKIYLVPIASPAAIADEYNHVTFGSFKYFKEKYILIIAIVIIKESGTALTE